MAGVAVAEPEMLFVIVTEQMSTPPPPFETPSHWVTWVIGWAEVVVVVAQVPAPAPIGPAAPEQVMTVIVFGVPVADPPAVTKFTTVTVQETPCPPTLLAVMLLHWLIGALSGAAFAGAPPEASTARIRKHIARMLVIRWIVFHSPNVLPPSISSPRQASRPRLMLTEGPAGRMTESSPGCWRQRFGPSSGREM